MPVGLSSNSWEKHQKIKRYMDALIKKYEEQFLSIWNVLYHCSKHKPGCGCMSNQFIERARNNFSLILSQSEAAEEFATKIRTLVRHARDEHECRVALEVTPCANGSVTISMCRWEVCM